MFRAVSFALILHAASCLCSIFAADVPRVHALLIGVTEYESLTPQGGDLSGPANDVLLMKDTLLQLVPGLPEEQIVVLSEAQKRHLKPTYANIKREFDSLAQRVRDGHQGHQVVILFAGHGSQIPNNDPEAAADHEIDGLDEVFLPRDFFGQWDDAKPEENSFRNAIRDDELRGWLNAIRSAGADVLFISDSCHSDTQTRAMGTSRTRGLDLMPASVLRRQASVPQAPATEPVDLSDKKDDAPKGDLIAFYAATSSEKTPDRIRLPGTEEEVDGGLLTTTICNILRTNQTPVTYRDLAQQISQQYSHYRDVSPPVCATVPRPTMQGTNLDRVVLGTSLRIGKPRFQYEAATSDLKVFAGSISGLRVGSILRLLPPSGSAEADATIGWAVVDSVAFRTARATVVDYKPDSGEWTERVSSQSVPRTGRCELEMINYGQTSVALFAETSFTDDRELSEVLADLVDDASSPVKLVPENEAEFRLVLENGYLFLRRSIATPQQFLATDLVVGPHEATRTETLAEAVKRRLDASFKTIWRAKSLLDITAQLRPHNRDFTTRGPVSVSLEMQQWTGTDWQAVGSDGSELPVRSKVDFVVRNHSRSPVRFSLLYIGDDYSIHNLYPEYGDDPNTIAAARQDQPATFRLSDAKRNTQTLRMASRMTERVVVIATRSSEELGAASDFSYMAQRGLPLRNSASLREKKVEARDWEFASSRRGRELAKPKTASGRPEASPLQHVLATAAFEPGKTRAMGDTPETDETVRFPDYSISTVSWRAVQTLEPLGDTAALSLWKQADTLPWLPAVSGAGRGGVSQTYKKAAPAIVVVRTESAHGTGFFISDDGWIVTNHHVVEDAAVDQRTGNCTVMIHYGTLEDGWMTLSSETLTAEVYKWDEHKDLALLKLTALPKGWDEVPFIQVAEEAAGPGTRCIAIGHPSSGMLWTLRSDHVQSQGLWPRDHIDTVMQGLHLASSGMHADVGDPTERREIVEESNKRTKDQLRSRPQQKVLQSGCGLNPGDSGGPLLNTEGQLIAVTFAIPSEVRDDKFSYHVHLDEVKAFIAERPDSPMSPEAPTPWDDAAFAAKIDISGDGVIDTLLVASSNSLENAILLFDLDQDSDHSAVDKAESLSELQNEWEAEFALSADLAHVFYDVDGDGKFDLIGHDTDGDEVADSVWRLSDEKWTSKPERLDLLSLDHFEPEAGSQFAKAFRRAIVFTQKQFNK